MGGECWSLFGLSRCGKQRLASITEKWGLGRVRAEFEDEAVSPDRDPATDSLTDELVLYDSNLTGVPVPFQHSAMRMPGHGRFQL